MCRIRVPQLCRLCPSAVNSGIRLSRVNLAFRLFLHFFGKNGNDHLLLHLLRPLDYLYIVLDRPYPSDFLYQYNYGRQIFYPTGECSSVHWNLHHHGARQLLVTQTRVFPQTWCPGCDELYSLLQRWKYLSHQHQHHDVCRCCRGCTWCYRQHRLMKCSSNLAAERQVESGFSCPSPLDHSLASLCLCHLFQNDPRLC